MNVLLTSVGRRAYMVKYFKEVLGESGQVHVSNSDDSSVAFKYADQTVLTPLIYDKNYIHFLLDYCCNNGIKIVIPLFDMDVLMLAKHKEEFEKVGVRVVVSDNKIVSICNDKWKTYEFLRSNGFAQPKSYLKVEDVSSAIERGDLLFPIVVKPRFGCGSIGVTVAYDNDDLLYLTKKVRRDIENSYLKYESAATNDVVLYQECLVGQEYGADLINDLNGNHRNVIVRKKLAMRSGETDIAELVDEPVIWKVLTKLGGITNHIANMDCDIFMVDGTPYILEMNARFGGGYPFSHIAGCNLPKAIVEWTRGNQVDISLLEAVKGITAYKEIEVVKK